MTIEVSSIGPDGLFLEETYLGDTLAINTQDLKFASPLAVKAFLVKAINLINVKLEVTSRVIICCSRCLKELGQDYYHKFELNFSIDKATRVIDIDQDLREEIILSLPLRLLCKKDCLGLCYKCGKDLNEEKCSCN